MAKSLSRREFLKIMLTTAAGTGALGGGLSVYGHEIGAENIEVTQALLTLPRLAPEFDGYRILQLSDLHADEWMTPQRLQHIVALANQQGPDLIAITGDFVTHEPERFAAGLIEALRALAPRDAAVAVLGNHDHWSDAEVIYGVIRASNLTDVNNGVLTLRREGALLHVAGVDDIWTQHHDLASVLSQLPEEGAAILLAHEPDFADESAASGRFDLQISGHSHGGQIILPFWGPPVTPHLAKKYSLGRYQVGDMIQYTNRGVGMSGLLRIRINCRPEITVFTLRAAR